MTALDPIRWNRSLDDYLMLVVDREQRQRSSQQPITPPSFYEGRKTPKFKNWLYHFFMTIGVVCMALIFGGMLGVLLRRLVPAIP